MKNFEPHTDLYTFRINKQLKERAQKELGGRLARVCRQAIILALKKPETQPVPNGKIGRFSIMRFIKG